MSPYPTAVEVNGTVYDIDASYLTALACIACINDPELSNVERAFGVLDLMYPDPPKDPADHDAAIKQAVKFLRGGREPPALTEDEESEDEEADDPDMDFGQDMHYIRSSFRSDYGIDLSQRPDMHFWEFLELLQGLSDDCVLSRVREIRSYDLSTVRDPKARARAARAKRTFSLEKKRDPEEQRHIDSFYAQLK